MPVSYTHLSINLKMMKKLYLVLMVISLFSISCAKNISDDTSEIMEYDKLFSNYGWENVAPVSYTHLSLNGLSGPVGIIGM